MLFTAAVSQQNQFNWPTIYCARCGEKRFTCAG
ncbi:hypothetical protein T05_16286 [Trichinella murrelli]|uniref:Uncharacterized protein n=1 Tax=Trichinella murrelli TaxID=144512 RepID=A0A0V0ST20_9BILA|nr:hypothetical protein T05_16286 [Trichinella murrelli]